MTKGSAFFVTPIGAAGSPERERADRMLEYVLGPVLGDLFDLVRADHVDSPGSINHDIISRLAKANLVVADLTWTNPNVMYEVGIRHTFNLPIIQIAQTGQHLPFDLGTERTIFFDISDLRDVDNAKSRILGAAKSSQSEGYQGPIARTLGLSVAYQENKTIAQAIEELSDKVDDLESSISSLDFSDYGSSGSLSRDEREELRHIYDVISAIRPYEVNQLAAVLRRLARQG